MKKYRYGWFFRFLYNRYIWNIPKPKTIYLTFDDGPIPEVTDWVLRLLSQYNAKATFFCIGDNIDKNRECFNKILLNEHSVGSHTYNHLNGWNTNFETYRDNFDKAHSMYNFKLFRPPYGKITNKQSRAVLEKSKIVMWSVISHDYDINLNKEVCLNKTIAATKEGDIIVFHDSLKAWKNLEYVLPRYLEHFSKKGFIFKKIE